MRLPQRMTALAAAAITLVASGTIALTVTGSAHAETTSADAGQVSTQDPSTQDPSTQDPSAQDPSGATVDPASYAPPLSSQDKAALLLLAHEVAVRQAAQARKHAAEVHVQQLRTRIVSLAKKQIGDRYSAGRAGPNAFDCSGLVLYVYKQVTGKSLPHYSGAQYTRVKRIPRSQARPGDIVFFLRNGAHHVGIYIGNGHMVDAAGYGKGVRISPISGSWWSRSFTGIGRLLPA